MSRRTYAEMSEVLFEAILEDQRKVDEVALAHIVTERTVYMVREAGSWARWPYIVTKKRHGYMTPEYKASLERQGLPLHPPKKTTGTYTFVRKDNGQVFRKKQTGFQRLIAKLRRKK